MLTGRNPDRNGRNTAHIVRNRTHRPRLSLRDCRRKDLRVSNDNSVPRRDKLVVLVVEDEYLVRRFVVDAIEDAGYVAVQADDADAAIAILETRKDIRIVFTDIEMPGTMDGLKLARAIRDRWPPIDLMITSGKHRLDDDRIPERGRFLPKPYNPDLVVETIGLLVRS